MSEGKQHKKSYKILSLFCLSSFRVSLHFPPFVGFLNLLFVGNFSYFLSHLRHERDFLSPFYCHPQDEAYGPIVEVKKMEKMSRELLSLPTQHCMPLSSTKYQTTKALISNFRLGRRKKTPNSTLVSFLTSTCHGKLNILHKGKIIEQMSLSWVIVEWKKSSNDDFICWEKWNMRRSRISHSLTRWKFQFYCVSCVLPSFVLIKKMTMEQNMRGKRVQSPQPTHHGHGLNIHSSKMIMIGTNGKKNTQRIRK